MCAIRPASFSTRTHQSGCAMRMDMPKRPVCLFEIINILRRDVKSHDISVRGVVKLM